MPTLKRWNETTQLWEPLQLIGAELGAPNGVATLDESGNLPLQQFQNHTQLDMPHQFVDGLVTYRWGFRVVDGEPQFVYEEVI